MKLTIYGKDVVLRILFVTIVIDVIAYFVNIVEIKLVLIAVSILLFAFTLFFFRDPKRNIPDNITKDTILSPADGKIVLIEDIKNHEENIFPIDEPLKKVSIFLSAFNVHVNRIPISGIIKYFKYVKGNYVLAFNNKASELNERTEIGIENENSKKLIFKQIAGFVARRIICPLRKGDGVIAGKKFGMIKFGSRVDILFKPDAVLNVKKGQKVVGGETIIAEL
ncbi:MAG: phosphatidylserine decarboxylase family protein [Bacteroidetes bacterium]|nr:phosphatidylserine decarboxylase family protein [Bacteroidota bacterium]